MVKVEVDEEEEDEEGDEAIDPVVLALASRMTKRGCAAKPRASADVWLNTVYALRLTRPDLLLLSVLVLVAVALGVVVVVEAGALVVVVVDGLII